MNKPLTRDALQRALDYPYRIPEAHFRFDPRTGDHALLPDLRIVGHRVAHADGGVEFYDVEASAGGETLRLDAVCPVVAAGSNASPEQLKRKFSGKTTTPMVSLQAEFAGIVPVFSAHFTGYGAVAACLGECAGASARLFVTLLPAAELEVMHATESLGESYVFDPLPAGVSGAGALDGMRLLYYRSLHGPLKDTRAQPIALSSFALRNCLLPVASERTLLPRVLAALFPDRSFEDALASILASPALRADATERLASLPLDSAVSVT